MKRLEREAHILWKSWKFSLSVAIVALVITLWWWLLRDIAKWRIAIMMALTAQGFINMYLIHRDKE